MIHRALTLILLGWTSLALAADVPPLELARDKASSYRIHHSPDAPASVRLAARELKQYIAKASGADLPFDVAVQVPAEPFISLGQTAAAKAVGLSAQTIPAEGFRIVTRGPNLFILGPDSPDGQRLATGGTTTGTLNGVYAFLEDYLGVRWLLPGPDGEDVPRVERLSVPALDRNDKPAFLSRRLPYVQDKRDDVKEWWRRNRQGRSIDIQHGHYWQETVPAKLFQEHPDWFPEINGVRVPPVGRYKLETTNPQLVKFYAARAVEAFRKNPQLYCYSLSPSDSRGYSTSKESQALYDKDPHGNFSVTPLILSFYNNVARLVRQQCPDKLVAGYIYADYLYPPSKGLPTLEPNLFLVVAPSFCYGYTLYRPDIQNDFDSVMGQWSKLTGQIGYYDLPTNLGGGGVPTAPGLEILQFIYPRLLKYNVKLVYIYGEEAWGSSALGNYLKARLNWDPTANVRQLAEEFCARAYGSAAGPVMLELFDKLDAATKRHYNADPRASYTLTPEILKDVYAGLYPELETLYLKAKAAAGEPAHQARLAMFEKNLVMLQWNLRQRGMLKSDVASPLYRSDAQVEQMLQDPANTLAISPVQAEGNEAAAAETVKVRELAAALKGAARLEPYLLRGPVRLLLAVPQDDEVRVGCGVFNNRNNEIIRYSVRDSLGRRLASGIFKADTVIAFSANRGQNYFLDIQADSASYSLKVSGAHYLLRGLDKRGGLRLLSKTTPAYFYVPAGADFSVTLSSDSPGETAAADLLAPSGKVVGVLDTSRQPASRLEVRAAAEAAGFWTVRFKSPSAGMVDDVYLKVDGPVAPWFGLEAERLIAAEK